MLILVGDNPFHGVSHLSQERARVRGDAVTNPEYAADLAVTSLKNGADGFMFSVTEKTLFVLKMISRRIQNRHLRLYAIIPAAYEYVRLAGQKGMSGLAKNFAKQILTSGNTSAVISCLRGIARTDLASLMKSYVQYEVFRIKSSSGRQIKLDSMFLHEIVTDICLALDLKWLITLYMDFMSGLGIKPGFETRNFAFLVNKFREWNIDFRKIVIAAPFNKVGFQMSPSRAECEQALRSLPEPNVIAISVLAGGYLDLLSAMMYLKSLPNLKGVAVGISNKEHACETFKFLRDQL
jgi:hypothetical protein